MPALRVLAEAGWITVVYSAASVIVTHQPPILGPVELSLFVVAGAVAGWLGRARSALGPLLLIGAVLLGGAGGWLANAEARTLLDDLPRAFNVHLAGWLAGVAVLRGALISPGQSAANEIERLTRSVPVALAVIWAYTSIVATPTLWLPFAVGAMWGTVAFLSAAVVALGLARLNVLHADVTDKRQRRGWRWLVTAVGFGVVPIALPIAVLTGVPLAAMLNPIVGPLRFVGDLLTIPLSWIVWILSELFKPIAGPLGQFLDALQARFAGRPEPEQQEPALVGTLIGLAFWVLALLAVLLVIFLIAQWLLKRKGVNEEALEAIPDTERAIVIPQRDPKPRSNPFRHRRHGTPTDAVSAYLSALAELEAHPELSRLASETPADHAARLRSEVVDPDAATDLARLAAGYQLARYADRRITPLENVRSVTRFQRIRRLLKGSTA